MVCNAFIIYLWFICDGVRMFCDGSIVFLVGLPHCFYIMHFKSFKRLLLAYGCFYNHNIYIYIYIYCLNTHLIMNVAYLKVTCGLRFHLFFFSVPVFCRFVLPCQLSPIKTVGSAIRQRKMLPVKLCFINVYTYNPKPNFTVMQIH